MPLQRIIARCQHAVEAEDSQKNADGMYLKMAGVERPTGGLTSSSGVPRPSGGGTSRTISPLRKI